MRTTRTSDPPRRHHSRSPFDCEHHLDVQAALICAGSSKVIRWIEAKCYSMCGACSATVFRTYPRAAATASSNCFRDSSGGTLMVNTWSTSSPNRASTSMDVCHSSSAEPRLMITSLILNMLPKLCHPLPPDQRRSQWRGRFATAKMGSGAPGVSPRPLIAACPLDWRPARVIPPIPGSVASQRDDPGPAISDRGRFVFSAGPALELRSRR